MIYLLLNESLGMPLFCRPPRMNAEKFHTLHFLPDPVPDQTHSDPTAAPGEDLHYKCFEDIYGTVTTEDHRPSKNAPKKRSTLRFSPSHRHVTNIDMLLQCSECDQWRLLFCKTKLTKTQKATLRSIMDDSFKQIFSVLHLFSLILKVSWYHHYSL